MHAYSFNVKIDKPMTKFPESLLILIPWDR